MNRKNNKKNQKKSVLPKVLLLILLTLLLATEVVWLLRDKPAAEPDTILPSDALPDKPSPAPTSPTETAAQTQGASETEPMDMHPINLGYGITLERVDDYTGAYMEDGSDEVVSGIMMAFITNSGDQDLQFAKVEVAFPDGVYYFEISDLPAGASVVVLEKNRAAMNDGVPTSAIMKNTVFFQEKMNIHADVFEVSGASGMLNVKNMSDHDISGDIYIHYKNCVDDLFFGGIAYRVRIEGGLKAGEIRQIMTGHYNPQNCVIVAIEYQSENNA